MRRASISGRFGSKLVIDDFEQTAAGAQRYRQKLQMPFFYAIGNHDVANSRDEGMGSSASAAAIAIFLYKDVLF